MKCATLAVVLSVLMLSGCASVPSHTPQLLDWQQREARLQQLTEWRLEGRFAIKTASDSWSGSLYWQQRDKAYDINLSGPFGQGAVRLTGDPYRVVLNTSEGELVGHEGPEQLMYEALGWRIPISSLQYWAVGHPDPAKSPPLVTLDEFERIASLQQGEWHVSYPRYRLFQQIELPGKIVIKNQQLRVRLVIDHWLQPEE
ncbi:MAG: lipoprotein insertase outer membrane protein LolB [Gammaproteobacteria bacterium]|nr:lipoprotein insertase outer membrane protein LolB [Gammaproteobacteria bacterium]MCF6230184.1 lipoprotein insertase outer membrane protein LolB [Gammaproteobacteria bacterium]